MITDETRAKVASITVIVDDSPVVMIFTNVQAALKLKRKLREAFPDTVFTKTIEDKMIETYAKKTAGLIIQRHLLIPSSLANGDTRIELPMRMYSEASQPLTVCPVETGAPCPASYKVVLNERLKEAEKPNETAQAIAATSELYSKAVSSAAPATYKSPETQPVVLQRPDLYSSQILTTGGTTTSAPATPSVSTATASLVPVSLHSGNQLSTIAGMIGPSGLNTGLSVYNLAGNPAIQGIAGFASISGQPVRAVSALTPVSVGAIAGQPGYGNAFTGHLSVPPTIINPNYQNLHQTSSYSAFPSSQLIAAPSGSLNLHQISPVVSGSAIQPQLTANQTMGKVNTQPMSMMPMPIQSAAIGPTMIPISFSNINTFGQARMSTGLPDMHGPPSTAPDLTTNDHSKPKESSVYSSSIATRPKTSPETEPILALRGDVGSGGPDLILPGVYPPRAPETFFANASNVLYAKGATPSPKDMGTCRLLSEAVNAWRTATEKEQENILAHKNLDALIKDGPFHQYYKQISHQRAVDPMIDAEMPRMWPMQNQVALFLALSDQLFNQLPDNSKNAWFTHRETLFNMLTVEGITTKQHVQNQSQSIPQDQGYPTTAGGFVTMGAPLSLQPIDQITPGSISITNSTKRLPEVPKSQPLVGSQSSDSAVAQPTGSKQFFPLHPLIDTETVRVGQELLKSDVTDPQQMWLKVLFNMPSNAQLDTQIPDSLTATESLRQKLEPGTQEAIAQMITQLNFTCNKPNTTNPNTRGGLALLTNNLSIDQSLVNYLIPPDDILKVDVFILLYLLSLGGNVQKLPIDSREFELLYKEFPIGSDKNHLYERYSTLCMRLVTLYQNECFMEIQASKLGPLHNESILGNIRNYVSSAQKENTLLKLALQKNEDPSKAISSLTSILLDEEHILFVLYGSSAKHFTITDKNIDFLLEGIAFMNRQLTRKEFYRRGRLSKPMINTPCGRIPADLNPLMTPKKQIRL